MARESSPIRFTPWLHAAIVGVVAGLAYLEGIAQQLGGGWMALALIILSRALGAFLSAAPQLPRRRAATQAQLLEDLKILTRRLVGATHGLTSQAAVIVGEIDLLIERLNGKS